MVKAQKIDIVMKVGSIFSLIFCKIAYDKEILSYGKDILNLIQNIFNILREPVLKNF